VLSLIRRIPIGLKKDGQTTKARRIVTDSILYRGKGTDDLFLPITSNYRFIGYEILPDFGVFDIYKSLDIPRAIEEYRQHLGKYCQ